jgi:hypothetical protein
LGQGVSDSQNFGPLIANCLGRACQIRWSEKAWRASSSSFNTVFSLVPVMRLMARIEMFLTITVENVMRKPVPLHRDFDRLNEGLGPIHVTQWTANRPAPEADVPDTQSGMRLFVAS